MQNQKNWFKNYDELQVTESCKLLFNDCKCFRFDDFIN